mgnify:CR=1 FL=1
MRSISLQVREPWLPDGKIIEVERKLKPEELVRTIPIPKEKPLLKYFLEWVETGKPETYIFYSYHDPQKPFSRFNGNKILRKADPEGKLWPHLLRHIRCSELVRRYGLSLIHISEPTRTLYISYAVYC